MSAAEKAALPPVEHPLVREHPTTGRKAIYAGSHAARIVGRSEEESERLVAEVDRLADDDRFAYTHRWRPGDILIWDNRSVEHRQMPYDDDNVKRVMRRATVQDELTRVPTAV